MAKTLKTFGAARRKAYTVIGFYADSGQVVTDVVHARSGQDAARTFAAQRSDPSDVMIVDVIAGRHESAFATVDIVPASDLGRFLAAEERDPITAYLDLDGVPLVMTDVTEGVRADGCREILVEAYGRLDSLVVITEDGTVCAAITQSGITQKKGA